MPEITFLAFTFWMWALMVKNSFCWLDSEDAEGLLDMRTLPNSKNKSEKSEAQRFGKLSPREGGLDVTIPVPQRRNPPKLSEENVYLPLRIGMKFYNIMKVKPRPLKTVLKEKVMGYGGTMKIYVSFVLIQAAKKKRRAGTARKKVRVPPSSLITWVFPSPSLHQAICCLTVFFLIAWVFDEFEVQLLAANKKYQIHPECTCGCLHRLMSEEQERK
ncbi:hypothetical protein MJT46_016449 [Ovis ammon polii x Ovis aries]|nr:hypothetical protein MJT46_016449 [Ovis ammon polii x Ovis aries]